MKKTKFLPFLLVLPLLAGCDGSVSEPKFKKGGDKVEFTAFQEALDKLMKENALLKSEKGYYRPSYEVTAELEGSEEKTLKRGKDVLEENKEYNKTTMKLQGDAKNLVTKRVQETDYQEEQKDKTGKGSSSGSSKSTFYGQSYKENDAEYFVTAQMEGKYFTLNKGDQVSEDQALKDLYESQFSVSTVLMNSIVNSFLTKYAMANDELKAKYSFYMKKDVFTAEFKNEETTDSTNYTTVKVETVKFQLDLSNNEKVSFTHYSETETTETVKVSDMDEIEGDVTHKLKKSVSTAKAAKKSVHLKPQKLDKFTKYEFGK